MLCAVHSLSYKRKPAMAQKFFVPAPLRVFDNVLAHESAGVQKNFDFFQNFGR